ncbi:MAG: hypothetical protein DMG70_14365 [Acidobacteria bacterium]|nr:MAG: hypothetical protein DMG70_14365 [Acidobacteriota bacterium]PYY05481.1 MAG: hypothetical protein DMG69_26530 [Acidobacteriota bacterium]
MTVSPQPNIRNRSERSPCNRPKEGEFVITKHRVSAFAGTDVAMILRTNDIDTLVLFGMATSGVVLSTLLEAAADDFRLAVINHRCADLDFNLHDCLINRFFPSRAAVLSAREFMEASTTASSPGSLGFGKRLRVK